MFQTWLLKAQTSLLRKPKFKQWARLEDKKYDFVQAVEDSQPTLESIYGYLSTALVFPVKFEKIYWKDTVQAFFKVHSVTSTIRKIPITSNEEKTKSEKDVWDYSGRLWYLYMNIIASAYGWSVEDIAKLEVDDALALLQEILTDKQLEREFIWSTTEIAYPYDDRTKQSKFVPMTRPYWMERIVEERKAPPVPKTLLPVGNVVRIKDETKKTGLGADVEAVSTPETLNRK